MEICVISSGSSGNATYVRSSETAILIDSGISLKELARRMAAVEIDPDSIDAVLVSHGHSDHVTGVPVLCRRKGVPVFASPGTIAETGLAASVPRGGALAFTTGVAFNVGDLCITPFPVPHDASEPVGFVVSDGNVKACFATDLGSLTLDVVYAFSGCDAIVLESNHDEVMLVEGPYPAFLKKRVAGPHGHLSNSDAAELLQGIAHSGLRHLVLAHLSRTNNAPELPVEAAVAALGSRYSGVHISLGWQDRAGEFITLG